MCQWICTVIEQHDSSDIRNQLNYKKLKMMQRIIKQNKRNIRHQKSIFQDTAGNCVA